jgi:hypothetical protein
MRKAPNPLPAMLRIALQAGKHQAPGKIQISMVKGLRAFDISGLFETFVTRRLTSMAGILI